MNPAGQAGQTSSSGKAVEFGLDFADPGYDESEESELRRQGNPILFAGEYKILRSVMSRYIRISSTGELRPHPPEPNVDQFKIGETFAIKNSGQNKDPLQPLVLDWPKIVDGRQIPCIRTLFNPSELDLPPTVDLWPFGYETAVTGFGEKGLVGVKEMHEASGEKYAFYYKTDKTWFEQWGIQSRLHILLNSHGSMPRVFGCLELWVTPQNLWLTYFLAEMVLPERNGIQEMELLRDARKLTQEWLKTAEGRAYVRQIAEAYLKEAEKAGADPVRLRKARKYLENHFEELMRAAKEAAQYARSDNSALLQGDSIDITRGETRGLSMIVVTKTHETAGQMAVTMAHEAGHVAVNKLCQEAFGDDHMFPRGKDGQKAAKQSELTNKEEDIIYAMEEDGSTPLGKFKQKHEGTAGEQGLEDLRMDQFRRELKAR